MSTVDPGLKGSGLRVERGQNIVTGDVTLPRLIVKRSALEFNIDRMAEYCRDHGASLAPHAKTTMAPGILRRQLAAGAWGFTVANVVQAQTLRNLGIQRILIANELVEPRAIAWLAAEISRNEEFEPFVLVDSERGVSILDSVLNAHHVPRPLNVLIELSEKGGRAGCRTDETATSVAAAVAKSKHLQLVGLEGFEALLEETGRTPFLRRLRSLATAFARDGYFKGAREIIVCAGTSEDFSVAAHELTVWDIELPVRTLLRPGGYATNAPIPGYERSLEIWGAVVSRPEPKVAIVGFGRRDVPSGGWLPVPVAVAARGQVRKITNGAKTVRLYDQHALVELSDIELEIGEFLGCSVQSPFRPAFATWRQIPLVDDSYTVEEVLDILY